MPKKNPVTVPEKLLSAAFSLFAAGRERFYAEDLVVKAWELFPDVFGLKGYPHPDSNRVYAELMGSKPVRKRGWLEKVGEKTYTVTTLGRTVANDLGANGSSSTQKVNTDRSTLSSLKKLLSSVAYKKVKEGREQEVTFFDACSFLGITPGSSSIVLSGKLANAQSLITFLESQVSEGSSTLRHGSTPVTTDDVEKLDSTLKLILSKFDSQFNVIRDRTDER